MGKRARQGRADQDMKQKRKVIPPIRERTQFLVFMVLLFLELDFLGHFKPKDLWFLTCMVPFIPESHVIATKIISPPSSQSVWVVSKEGREWRSTSFRSRLGQNSSDIEAGLAHSQLLVCYPSSLVNISSIRPCSGIYLDPG